MDSFTHFPRLTTDSHLPELATDDNPCTYWQSSSDEENVSLSFSLSPLLSELQLIQIQFISPPADLVLTVTSLGTDSVVAYVNSTCDYIMEDTIHTCIKFVPCLYPVGLFVYYLFTEIGTSTPFKIFLVV